MSPYRAYLRFPAWLCRWLCPAKPSDQQTRRVASLRRLREPLVVVSTAHLSDATFTRLRNNQLSVQTYVHAYGAFLYLGRTLEIAPEETDLREIVEASIQAEVAWLGFDVEGAVADGWPLFRDPAEERLL